MSELPEIPTAPSIFEPLSDYTDNEFNPQVNIIRELLERWDNGETDVLEQIQDQAFIVGRFAVYFYEALKRLAYQYTGDEGRVLGSLRDQYYYAEGCAAVARLARYSLGLRHDRMMTQNTLLNAVEERDAKIAQIAELLLNMGELASESRNKTLIAVEALTAIPELTTQPEILTVIANALIKIKNAKGDKRSDILAKYQDILTNQ